MFLGVLLFQKRLVFLSFSLQRSICASVSTVQAVGARKLEVVVVFMMCVCVGMRSVMGRICVWPSYGGLLWNAEVKRS